MFQDISQIGMRNEILMFSKSPLRNIAFTSYKFYNKNDYKFDNITKEGLVAFLELIKFHNIIIQKTGKYHGVFIVEKNVYIERKKENSKDTYKIQEVKFD